MTVMVIISLGSVYAVENVEITEVEANPEGNDGGNEWLEIYSEDEVDLEGWYLENEDGDIYNLSGSFDGYLVIEFEKQWLDNKDFEITLYDEDGDEVHSTDELSDKDNDDFTWQLCDGDWEFLDETKDDPNSDNEDCDEPDEDSDNEEFYYIPGSINNGNSQLLDLNNLDPSENNLQEISLEEIQEKIILQAPSSEQGDLEISDEPEKKQRTFSDQEKLRFGVVIGFMVLLLAISLFLIFRKL